MRETKRKEKTFQISNSLRHLFHLCLPILFCFFFYTREYHWNFPFFLLFVELVIFCVCCCCSFDLLVVYCSLLVILIWRISDTCTAAIHVQSNPSDVFRGWVEWSEQKSTKRNSEKKRPTLYGFTFESEQRTQRNRKLEYKCFFFSLNIIYRKWYVTIVMLKKNHYRKVHILCQHMCHLNALAIVHGMSELKREGKMLKTLCAWVRVL